MTWAELFDRAPAGVTEADVSRTLAARRADDGDPPSSDGEDETQ